MGCDIHAIVQAKTDSGWKDIPTKWDQDRHYFLFGWLAGVRNMDVTPLAQPRGLPPDFSVIDGDLHPSTLDVLKDWEVSAPDSDGVMGRWMGDHSRSWLTADEILATPPPQSPGDGDVLAYFVDEIRRLKAEHGEVRIVFGFDS